MGCTQTRYVVLETFKGFSKIFLTPCSFHLCALTSELSQCAINSHISKFWVSAVCLGFQLGVSATKNFARSRLLYRRASKHTPEAGVTVEGSGPTLQCCPAEPAPGPGIPHLACVCVYGLRKNTALTVSFTQTYSTKCLSELAFGPTRYNPIKRFTARQCSSLARSLETGIKKSVLRFQEQCQEQGLHFRLGRAGLICAAGGSGGSPHTSPPLIISSF